MYTYTYIYIYYSHLHGISYSITWAIILLDSFTRSLYLHAHLFSTCRNKSISFSAFSFAPRNWLCERRSAQTVYSQYRQQFLLNSYKMILSTQCLVLVTFIQERLLCLYSLYLIDLFDIFYLYLAFKLNALDMYNRSLFE